MSTLIARISEKQKELDHLNDTIFTMIDTPFLFARSEVRAAVRARKQVYKDLITLERVLR